MCFKALRIFIGERPLLGSLWLKDGFMNFGLDIEDVLKLNAKGEIPGKSGLVIDIRPEADFKRSSFPGAISLPCLLAGEVADEKLQEFCTKLTKILVEMFPDRCRDSESVKKFPVFLFSHAGRQSETLCEKLRNVGFNATNILGGWRKMVRIDLEKRVENEEERAKEQKSIEKSIIKTYHVDIWSPFIRALKAYELVNEGDRVMVCMSGGKDSFVLAKLFQELAKHKKVNFSACFVVMDPGYNPENRKIIEYNARLLGIPVEIFETKIFDSVENIEKNPCYLCARMRRGYLYRAAMERGCNKIALGHHFDDAIETVLMGMLYAGKFETMMPKLHSRNFPGMELIRPMYMIREEAIEGWRDFNRLSFIQCACNFTDKIADFGSQMKSSRKETKELIKELSKTNPSVAANLFKSMENVNLETILAYKEAGVKHTFLEKY